MSFGVYLLTLLRKEVIMKKVVYLLLSIFILVLVGCGGGGSGSSVSSEENNGSVDHLLWGVKVPSSMKVSVCTSSECPDTSLAIRDVDFASEMVLVAKAKKDLAPFGVNSKESVIVIPKIEKVAPYLAIAKALPEIDKKISYKDALKELERLGAKEDDTQQYIWDSLITIEDVALGLGLSAKDASKVAARLSAKMVLPLIGDKKASKKEFKEALNIKNELKKYTLKSLGNLIIHEIQEVSFLGKGEDYRNFMRFYNNYQCPADTEKEYIIKGLADNFSPSNPSIETPNPQGAPWSPVLQYDSNIYMPFNQTSGIFAESVGIVPPDIASGAFFVSLRYYKKVNPIKSLQNYYFIGDFSAGVNFHSFAEIENWSNYGNIKYKSLNSIQNSYTGTPLLYEIQNSVLNTIDFAVKNKVDVNYLGVIYCKKIEDENISSSIIPQQLKCGRNEIHTEQIFGIADDFANPLDDTTPSPALIAFFSSPPPYVIKYDQIIKHEGDFIDTLDLSSMIGSLYVSKAKVVANTRPSPAISNNSYLNDQILVGKYDSNILYHDPNDNSGIPTLNGGMAHTIDGNTILSSSGTLLDLINSDKKIDLVVQNQTQVDMAKVELCLTKEHPRDIAIDKNLTSIEQDENGNYYLNYTISLEGYLTSGQHLGIVDHLPANSTLISYNENGWNCTPDAPVNGPSDLYCSLLGPSNPIPTIDLVLKVPAGTDLDKIVNCVEIIKGVNTIYNSNPDNDKDCASASMCENSEDITINLENPNAWVDENGNHPVLNNVFAGTQYSHVWDPGMKWFNFGYECNTDHILKIEFCSCDSGYIQIEEMRSDNEGYIYLDDISNMIAQRVDYSQDTMGDWGPVVSGYMAIPPSSNGQTHTLYFKVHNHCGPSGGAVKGTLHFRGHLGPCEGAK